MTPKQIATALLDQSDELDYYRRRCHQLEYELSKYQQHVTDELQFWEKTYGNILDNLVNKEG